MRIRASVATIPMPDPIGAGVGHYTLTADLTMGGAGRSMLTAEPIMAGVDRSTHMPVVGAGVGHSTGMVVGVGVGRSMPMPDPMWAGADPSTDTDMVGAGAGRSTQPRSQPASASIRGTAVGILGMPAVRTTPMRV